MALDDDDFLKIMMKSHPNFCIRTAAFKEALIKQVSKPGYVPSQLEENLLEKMFITKAERRHESTEANGQKGQTSK
jgi:hypothetical protein